MLWSEKVSRLKGALIPKTIQQFKETTGGEYKASIRYIGLLL